MPTKPKHPCNQPGCNVLTVDRFCEPHQKVYDKRRPSSASRGYNYHWQQYRKNFLMQHPLCVKCERSGHIVPATQVDHIVPATGANDPSFFDSRNHQGLCESHHSEKTCRENGGFGH